MTLVYLGGLSVGDAVPGATLAVSAGMAGIAGALDNLLAQLAALKAFVPAPISFETQLALAQQMVSSVTAAIAAGLPVPDIAAQIAIIAAQAAALTAQITAITAQLDVLVDLQAPLGAAGVHGYAYDGPVNGFGGALASALSNGLPGGSPSDHANGVVYVTSIPGTWAAMGQILKVSP